MRFKHLVVFAAAASLAAAPAVAAGRAPVPLQPESERVEGSEMQAALVLPALAVLIPILLVLLLTGGGDEQPATSP
jgi:hypothetical protein